MKDRKILKFEEHYVDGEKRQIPRPFAKYKSWFAFYPQGLLNDAGSGRWKWNWALTDQAMDEIQAFYPDIESWLLSPGKPAGEEDEDLSRRG